MLTPLWIFLDFDGVIMDSMGLKLDSYHHALEPFGFTREAVRAEQLRTAGLSRFRILPAMYERLAGKPMPDAEYREALARFTEHDERSRSKMVLKTGAREFLVAARNRIPLVVVTGTPQAVIDETVRVFGLEPFFREVCGSPQGKEAHLRRQLRERNLQPEQALYVGDALHDFESAEACGIPFAGIDNGDAPFAGRKTVAVVSDLGALMPFVGLA